MQTPTGIVPRAVRRRSTCCGLIAGLILSACGGSGDPRYVELADGGYLKAETIPCFQSEKRCYKAATLACAGTDDGGVVGLPMPGYPLAMCDL